MLNFKYTLIYKFNLKTALILNLIKYINYYIKDFIKFTKSKEFILFNII
jgi:hypothetical protein